MNDLEKTVDELLRQSGIRSEKDITTFEELALKTVSIDEVRLRQAQLRAMRELMFRHDQKAKRVSKIKSKQYRKIHKRERERKKLLNGEHDDDNENMEKQLKLETARAKERMTLRHKNTGEWAKKMLSRGQHDQETRQAISEQIRRGDDLQRKILGTELESENDSDSAEELEELVRDPNKWGEDTVIENTQDIRKGVLGMKFMRDAEERQSQAIAEQVAEIRAMVNDGSDEENQTTNMNSSTVNAGRKKFTPGDKQEKSQKSQVSRMADKEEMDEEDVILKVVKNPFHMNKVNVNGNSLILVNY